MYRVCTCFDIISTLVLYLTSLVMHVLIYLYSAFLLVYFGQYFDNYEQSKHTVSHTASTPGHMHAIK